MKLILNVEGASPESLERGVAAAWRVFRWNAANPWETAVARFKREGWDEAGFPDDMKPSALEMKLAGVWDEAEVAALDACYGRERVSSDSGYLEVQK